MKNWEMRHYTMGRNVTPFQSLNNTASHAPREQSSSAKYKAAAKKIYIKTQGVLPHPLMLSGGSFSFPPDPVGKVNAIV